MKTLILTILLFAGYAQADQMQCESTCDNITKEQSDCVVKKRCYPEIKKLTKEKRDLEKRIAELEEMLNNMVTDLAILETENNLERELRNLHYGEVVDNAKKNRINLLLGKAPLGNIRGSVNNVRTERGTVLGLQYLRDGCFFGLNCGIQAQTNQTVMGTVGVGF